MWRNGDGDPTDDFEATAVAACLADEAARERPAFSPGFHAAVMQRVRAELPAAARPPQPRGPHAPPPRDRGRVSAGAAALAIGSGLALVLAIGFSPGQVRPGFPTGGRVDSVSGGRLSERPLSLEVTAAEETSLIERLPLFDDIDREVRSGVVLVASSLLDLPAWRDVADFDPAGFLGADPPR